MMLYLASNTIPDISFAVHQCAQFTHNTKASHETTLKRICRYLQCTKENGLVFNPYKRLVMDCYSGVDFAGLWGYENPQDPICASSINGLYIKPGICMAKNGKYTKHTRHISRRMHFVINGEECNFHKTLWPEGVLRLPDI